MIVFTRKHVINQNLKKRFFKKNKLSKLRFGTIGLYCLHSFRFEYRYCLFLRKFFKRLRRKHKRKVHTQQRRRTWLFIRPNLILTHKSKNARMGKGKGNFKRWCTIVHPGRVFIEHLNIIPQIYKRYLYKIKVKLKLQLHMICTTKTSIKNPTVASTFVKNTNKLEILRVRKCFYYINYQKAN